MKPLDGVRVVSLATNLPGPLAAARLAELGAEVTKVEPPSGDPHQGMRNAFAGKTTAELEAIARRADIPLTGVKYSSLNGVK